MLYSVFMYIHTYICFYWHLIHIKGKQEKQDFGMKLKCGIKKSAKQANICTYTYSEETNTEHCSPKY